MKQTPKRSAMDELCYAAQQSGWWVELATSPTRRGTSPRLTRLPGPLPSQARRRPLRDPPLLDADRRPAVAAAQLTQTLLEAA